MKHFAICWLLPEATERISHGEPAWFVQGNKLFVMFADKHHNDRVAFWGAAPLGVQHTLVSHAPGQFFVPPYVGHRGWLGVYLAVEMEWEKIKELVNDAYRTVSPKKLSSQIPGAS